MVEKQTIKQICTRCIVDSTVPGVTFDEQGVCTYCKLHDILDTENPQGDSGLYKLEQYIAQMKESGKNKRYDCVVGVSGGTDSIYLLYWAKQNGLRSLAAHFDNGWDSEIAVHNIQKALEKLEIDLQTYVVDWEEFKDILVSFLKSSLPWADIPTDIGITSTLYKIAAEENLKYILVGNNFRTEGKMPTEWTYSDGKTIKSIQKVFGTKKLRTFPNLTLFDFFLNSIVRKIRIIRPLNYMDYQKAQARALLENKLGWQYYGGHHFESIYTRFVYSYLLPHKFNIDKRIITHSALVRSGGMTRQEALDNLLEAPYPKDRVNEDIEYVIKKLGLTTQAFEEIMSLPPKSFRDYPSYYPIFEKFNPLVKAAMKFALPWTPPMLHEMDLREIEKQKHIKRY
jgi:N-acetyl sugar amidotransferase